MDFYDRVKMEVRKKGTTIAAVTGSIGMSFNTYNSTKRMGNLPRADQAQAIAENLGCSLEYLLTGRDVSYMDEKGEHAINGSVSLVPVVPGVVSAGRGQEMAESNTKEKMIPFLTRMLRGTPADQLRAVEVRGDSMTGVSIYDGDVVVYHPGEIRGDGIYVLRAGDELLVKRVEFDPYTLIDKWSRFGTSGISNGSGKAGHLEPLRPSTRAFLPSARQLPLTQGTPPSAFRCRYELPSPEGTGYACPTFPKESTAVRW